MHQKVENSTTDHIREPLHTHFWNVRCFLCPYWHMKRDHFQISFLSNNHEPCLSRSHSAEGEDKVTETEEIDVDDAEGGDFDEEEDAEEEDIGEFWGGMEDLGSVVRVGREEAAEDSEMWADLDSVWNSKVEAVQII